MLEHDPVPWLMAQEGIAALRARRRLGLPRAGDAEAARELVERLADEQEPDGSFEGSPMKTAGVLNLLADLRADNADEVAAWGASYLLSLLAAQPGFERARAIAPGSLRAPCDLCGFFGPHERRNDPQARADGAREMNHFRDYEPLLGSRAPVRGTQTSRLDRSGPGSCYTWGLVPLCFTLEAVLRSGSAADDRVQPAINALLGAQRASGGWCRNPWGHPECTVHALRALGAHPGLRHSAHSERGLRFLARGVVRRQASAGSGGSRVFGLLRAVTPFDLPVAREVLGAILGLLAPHQRRNGTFGNPCAVERVAAVLGALRALGPRPADHKAGDRPPAANVGTGGSR